jgi:hypothetical protein
MTHILDIKINVIYTTNLKHFNKYHEVGVKTTKDDMGSADTLYGYIWLNSDEHSKRPVSELLNTIVHEMLHIKYPDYLEKDIIAETHKYIPIQSIE